MSPPCLNPQHRSGSCVLANLGSDWKARLTWMRLLVNLICFKEKNEEKGVETEEHEEENKEGVW